MADSEFDKVVTDLRKRKIRLTSQRLIVLQYMMTHQNHPTAEDVYNDLKGTVNNISISTVYNSLKFLTKYTSINELTYDDRSIHFDYFHKEHYHAVCTRCGKVFDVDYSDYPALFRQLRRASGFEISKIEINIQGICPNCQKRVAEGKKS